LYDNSWVEKSNFLKAADEREYEQQRKARMSGKRFYDGAPREI
jgi:hypothetical protein